MKQNQKIWAKNDEMYLAQFIDSEAPQDPFKTIYVQQSGLKWELPMNPEKVPVVIKPSI